MNNVMGQKIDQNILRDAQILWDYCMLKQPLKKSDYILALGNTTADKVAEKAAELYHRGLADFIVVSGKPKWNFRLKGTKTKIKVSEADMMAFTLQQNGVPADKYLIEPNATNTEENFTKTTSLLKEFNLKAKSVIVVTKPYVERRAKATADIRIPDQDVLVASFDYDFNQYFSYSVSINQAAIFINCLVGTVSRILDYPRKGFQSKQPITQDVLDAHTRLIRAGIKGDYKYPPKTQNNNSPKP